MKKGNATQELLARGVERIFPSCEFVEERLAKGGALSVYLGIDPTGPTLHIGHLIPLLKLRDFQQAGHTVILLIGDFTATIGDPTDKHAVRQKLTREEVLANAAAYQAQAQKIISFEGNNAARVQYNSTWLAKLSFAEVLELASHISFADVAKRDMFQKRLAEGKELYFHETFYPMMQGYDSVALGVDGEVGGNDQTFNMLVGRDLAKKLSGKEKFVVAMKLLADAGGVKMGKTEGNMVAFRDAPAEAFGKIMSWPDVMIERGFELCTRVPMNEVPRGGNPKDAKMRLAYEVVALIHGASAARAAQESWEGTFSRGEPEEFINIPRAGAADALVEKKVIGSKSDLRRLIAEGAVTDILSGEKQGEGFLKSPLPGKYRVGKHRFVQII